MKRSILLPTLVMLAFIGCSREERLTKDRMVRNTYKSLDDCKRDYKAEFCEKQDETDWDDDEETSYHTTYYHGPMYPYWLYERQLMYYGGYPRSLGITSGVGPSRYFYPSSSFTTSSAGAKPGSMAASKGVTVTRGGFGSIGRGVSS